MNSSTAGCCVALEVVPAFQLEIEVGLESTSQRLDLRRAQHVAQNDEAQLLIVVEECSQWEEALVAQWETGRDLIASWTWPRLRGASSATAPGLVVLAVRTLACLDARDRAHVVEGKRE
jgi:hypothetical protein